MEKKPPGNMAVYALAWPIGMNAILQQAILLIDTILVGGLGEEALAAMGIATSIAGLILGVLFAFSNGTQILVAQAFGASSNTALKSGFWSGLVIGLLVAAIGIVFIIFFRDAIITRLTDVPSIATMASTYLLISTVFIIGLAVSQNISVFLYATGHPKIPFYSKLCELPFNALLSYLLIFGVWGVPALGLAGAAIGSAITVVLRTGFLFLYMKQVKFAYLLSPGWTNNRFSSTVSAFLSNALPIAGTFISMHFAFTLCLMLYSQLKVHEFAALTILLIWIRTSGMLVTAWCQAMGIWVGRLLGQDSYTLLDPFVKKAWKVALCLSVAIAAIFSVTPWLFDIFYPNLDDKTHNAVRLILPMLIILPLVRSSNVVCGNVLRASGQASYAFKVHVSTQWLFTVPVTALFVLVFKVPIVWVFGIIVAEELLKAIPFHLRIASGEWKQRIEI